MTRSKLLLAWGALLLGLSACDKTTSTDSDSGTSSLTVTVSPSEITAGGTSASVSIQATGAGKITSLKAEVLTSAGADASASFVTSFSPAPKSTDSVFSTNAWSVSAKPSASAESYKVRVTLTDKSGNTVKEYPFSVRSGSTTDPDPDPVDPDPITGEPLYRMGGFTAGAQGSSNGSFMELAGPTPGYLHTADGDFMGKDIDVVFGADGSVPSLMSPKYASTHGFNLSSWSKLNITEIVDMGTLKPANTGEIYEALMDNSASSVAVVVNHYYGVGTEGGELLFLKVTSLTGSGSSANAGIDVYLVEGGSVTDPDPLDPLWPKIELGAQNATPPSALDVDGNMAYSVSVKDASKIASIDLLLYNESTGGLRFVSPEYAFNKSFSVVNGWGQTNATFFYDNGTTPVTSLEQTQWILEGMDTEQYINVIAGHYYIVEHSGGVTSVIKVESITGSGSSAVVKVSIVFSDDTFAG